MSKNKTMSLTFSKQIKEKYVWRNNLPLNIIKLATMDHMEWTASGQCGHCHDNDCYHVNGTCLSGCMAGYRGNRCRTRVYTCICKSTVKRLSHSHNFFP